ncbi:MAG: hypothetical protein E7015_03175 [Alphaproteobacteria bacterium]|nr:hypothetical protein [Alphaproteobacteria bacterium]
MKKIVLPVISYGILFGSINQVDAQLASWQPKTTFGQKVKNFLTNTSKSTIAQGVNNFINQTQTGQMLKTVGQQVGQAALQNAMGCSNFAIITNNLTTLKSHLQTTGVLSTQAGIIISAQINTTEQAMSSVISNLSQFSTTIQNITLQNIDPAINQIDITVRSIQNFNQQYSTLSNQMITACGIRLPTIDSIWMSSKTYMLTLVKSVLNKKKQLETSLQQVDPAVTNAVSNLLNQMTQSIFMGVDVNHPYSVENLKISISNIQAIYNSIAVQLADENLRQSFNGLSQYMMDATDAAMANKINQWGTQTLNSINTTSNNNLNLNGTITNINGQMTGLNSQLQNVNNQLYYPNQSTVNTVPTQF